MRGLITTILALFVATCAQAQETTAGDNEFNSSEFNGAWQNQSGSLVTLIVDEGEVHGTYQTNVGQPDKNQIFALIGLVEGDQITFTVNFKGYGSMTAWVGQMTLDEAGNPYIRTLWHLTRDKEDDQEKDDLWQSIITGASDFVAVK